MTLEEQRKVELARRYAARLLCERMARLLFVIATLLLLSRPPFATAANPAQPVLSCFDDLLAVGSSRAEDGVFESTVHETGAMAEAFEDSTWRAVHGALLTIGSGEDGHTPVHVVQARWNSTAHPARNATHAEMHAIGAVADEAESEAWPAVACAYAALP